MTIEGTEPRTFYLCLWRALKEALHSHDPNWEARIETKAPIALQTLLLDASTTDAKIFEAFAVALVSGNTRWDRIARIRSELATPFLGFDPRQYGSLSDEDFETRVLSWFSERKAGAANLRGSLLRFKAAAAKLTEHQGENSATIFLRAVADDVGGAPEAIACALGTSTRWKLPGFGIALAAEALRNLGVDMCKPDRHVARAMGSWKLVDFRQWDRRGSFTPPQPSVAELMKTMFAVRAIADANRETVTYTNSVIWHAGAVSGARFTNIDFEKLARACSLAKF